MNEVKKNSMPQTCSHLYEATSFDSFNPSIRSHCLIRLKVTHVELFAFVAGLIGLRIWGETALTDCCPPFQPAMLSVYFYQLRYPGIQCKPSAVDVLAADEAVGSTFRRIRVSYRLFIITGLRILGEKY